MRDPDRSSRRPGERPKRSVLKHCRTQTMSELINSFSQAQRTQQTKPTNQRQSRVGQVGPVICLLEPYESTHCCSEGERAEFIYHLFVILLIKLNKLRDMLVDIVIIP